MKNSFIGYITSRSYLEERTPQHIQNKVIRDFCAEKNFFFNLSATEHRINGCFKVFEGVVGDLKKDLYDGIVSYSLFQLPEDDIVRKDLVFQVLKKKKRIFCVVENLKITSMEEFYHADIMFRLKKISNINNPDFKF